MSAVLDSWKLDPWDFMVSFPWLNPQTFCHSELPVCFSIVAPSRINWAGVTCDRVVLSKFCRGCVTSAERNFLNNRTPISARFGQGVWGPVGNLFILCIRQNACISWGWWKAMSAQIAFGFIWEVSIHSWSLEMTSDGEVLLHGYAFWVRGSTNQNYQKSNGLISNVCRTMIQEDEISKFFCSSGNAWSVRFRPCRIAEWARLHRMLVKVINPSWNVQVSCSFLELCRRHMVVLQVKVFQVAYIKQLVKKVLKRFTIWIFTPNSRRLLIAHARLMTPLDPVWQMGPSRLEVLFLFVTV